MSSNQVRVLGWWVSAVVGFVVGWVFSDEILGFFRAVWAFFQ